MASDGTINFQTTSDRELEEVLSLEVYRGDTKDRTAPLAFDVPSALIAPAHLLFHPTVGINPAYYEVIAPEIIRVSVNPSARLQIASSDTSVSAPDVKRFSYVILGDAATLHGLAAPYNEEETKQIAHMEELTGPTDFFQFWRDNQNTDQVTGKTFEARQLQSL